MCANAKFVDVDYELLLETKRQVINNTPEMRDLIHPIDQAAQSKDKSVLVDSDEYAAIGCDLRNILRLERLLRSIIDVDQCLVLCVAEVSITYMQTDAADALISWSSTLSTGTIVSTVWICLLFN